MRWDLISALGTSWKWLFLLKVFKAILLSQQCTTKRAATPPKTSGEGKGWWFLLNILEERHSFSDSEKRSEWNNNKPNFKKHYSKQAHRKSTKDSFGSPGGAVVKNLPANAGDTRDAGLISSSGIYPRGRNDPLQCSCLRDPMDRGAWWATICGAAKSQIPPSN